MSMIEPIAKPLRFLAPGLLLFGLAGCLGKPAPVTNFYVLNATAAIPDEAPSADGVSLFVAEVQLPDYLERGQIVGLATANRLALSEFELWGGNLRKDVGRVLAANLGRLLGTPNLMVSPLPARDRPRYRVEVTVLGFEFGPDAVARLNARWTVRRDSDGAVVGGGLERLRRDAAGAADMDATVAAMSALLGQLSERIAAAVPAS